MTARAAYTPTDWALLLARALMASLFLWSGAEKAFDPAGAAAFAGSRGIPFAHTLIWGAVALELGCGLALLVGWRTRTAALLLAAWMTILGPWFHPFWNSPPAMWQMMVDDFFHHFVMTGGMIYLAVFGPGAIRVSRASNDS